MKIDKKLYEELKESLTVHHEGGSITEPLYDELKDVIEIILKSKLTGSLLYKFWQRTSDACPLEIGQAEEQEMKFKEWTKTLEVELTDKAIKKQ